VRLRFVPFARWDRFPSGWRSAPRRSSGSLGLGQSRHAPTRVVRSARITGRRIAAMRTVVHSCSSRPAALARVAAADAVRPLVTAAVVPGGCGRASGPTRAVTGSRAERFVTSTSACAIRDPRTSKSGACREWRACARPLVDVGAVGHERRSTSRPATRPLQAFHTPGEPGLMGQCSDYSNTLLELGRDSRAHCHAARTGLPIRNAGFAPGRGRYFCTPPLSTSET
jgi:hypothetical protein